MKRLWRWIQWRLLWMFDWATKTEPTYTTVTTGSRDRTLRGKARRKARRHG